MASTLSSKLMIYYLEVFSKIEKFIFVASTGGGVPTVGHRRDLGIIFKVIFQGLFFGIKFFRHVLGVP